ncbi:hypothetical protein KEM48_011607 [Puccinia striiformis f. sp. tritici PST-130]|nr:hypothetical protein KEM48_011607 [Puccinia striiformis f. sp. tritici PST-130]
MSHGSLATRFKVHTKTWTQHISISINSTSLDRQKVRKQRDNQQEYISGLSKPKPETHYRKKADLISIVGRSGYEPIKFKRNLPIRGPSGSLIMSGVFVTCLYGFYRYGQGNLEKRELKRENMWSRIHLVPILTAENDRDQFRRNRAQLDREREIMKDDPDWVVGQSVYNTKVLKPPSHKLKTAMGKYKASL